MNIYTNKVRVMKNTLNSKDEEMNEMIGQELEVRTNTHYDKKVGVYNKDKSDFRWFNESDVRFLTPAKFKGNSIAIGDYVEGMDSSKGIVSGFYVYDGENKIVLETKEDGSWIVSEENIKAHTTTLEEETTTYGGKTYNKKAFEAKLSELKEIK